MCICMNKDMPQTRRRSVDKRRLSHTHIHTHNHTHRHTHIQTPRPTHIQTDIQRRDQNKRRQTDHTCGAMVLTRVLGLKECVSASCHKAEYACSFGTFALSTHHHESACHHSSCGKPPMVLEHFKNQQFRCERCALKHSAPICRNKDSVLWSACAGIHSNRERPIQTK